MSTTSQNERRKRAKLSVYSKDRSIAKKKRISKSPSHTDDDFKSHLQTTLIHVVYANTCCLHFMTSNDNSKNLLDLIKDDQTILSYVLSLNLNFHVLNFITIL